MDTKEKTAVFITKSLEVREQFSFAHPMEMLRAVKIYCCDHYGSMLWDLSSERAFEQVDPAGNTPHWPPRA